MTTNRTQRGEVPAFLNSQAEWIKGNLGISQIEIARKLLTRTGAPMMLEGAMEVALSRWLNKRGLSGKALKADLAAAQRQSGLAVSEFEAPSQAPPARCEGKASGNMEALSRGPDPLDLPTQGSPEQQLDAGSPPAPVGASPSLSTEARPSESFGFAGQLPEKVGNADAPLVPVAPTKLPRKRKKIVKDDSLIRSGDRCRHKSNLDGARTADIEW